MSKTPVDPAPADYTACPMWGQGGRYIVDATGKRVRVPDETPPPPAAAETSAAPAAPETTKRGR